MPFQPERAQALTGSEAFRGLDARVSDFWSFAMSDLRTNNIRGHLAEYLVARAVGSKQLRVEWDPWDVTAPDGTRIEVKSSGYLQAWAQKDLSKPTFRVAPTFGWDAQSETWTAHQTYHADVYVFALHTARTHEEYDPLDVGLWAFHVASRSVIEQQGGASMGPPTLRRVCGESVAFGQVEKRIRAAAGDR